MSKPPEPVESIDLAVVGGGISGLAAAYQAKRLHGKLRCRVFEAADRVGGLLQTSCIGGFTIERGPDSIYAKQAWTRQFLEELGLGEFCIKPRQPCLGASILHRGRLLPIPKGFSLRNPVQSGLMRSPLLSLRGKVRAWLGAHAKLSRSTRREQSVAGFFRDRYGHELWQVLAEPLVGGIYGANPETLSITASLPDVAAQAGLTQPPLIPGDSSKDGHHRQDQARGAAYQRFLSFTGGLEMLPLALKQHLGEEIATAAPVDALRLGPESATARWQIKTANGQTFSAHRVILAVPAWRAARLLRPDHAALAGQLSRIEHGSGVTATYAWRSGRQASELPRTFGYLVPSGQRRAVMACTFASRKYSHRAPEKGNLVRVFCVPELADANETDIHRQVQSELRQLIALPHQLEVALIDRYPRCMPFYTLGHEARLQSLVAHVRALPGLYLAGNSLEGVGIPDALASGLHAATAAIENRPWTLRRGQPPPTGFVPRS